MKLFQWRHLIIDSWKCQWWPMVNNKSSRRYLKMHNLRICDGASREMISSTTSAIDLLANFQCCFGERVPSTARMFKCSIQTSLTWWNTLRFGSSRSCRQATGGDRSTLVPCHHHHRLDLDIKAFWSLAYMTDWRGRFLQFHETKLNFRTLPLVTRCGFIIWIPKSSVSPVNWSSPEKTHPQVDHRPTNGSLDLLCCWTRQNVSLKTQRTLTLEMEKIIPKRCIKILWFW